MITLVLGGDPEDGGFKYICQSKKETPVLSADTVGDFGNFCRFLVRSTQRIRSVSYGSELAPSKVANDDIVVLFSSGYLERALLAGTYLLKIATAIEMALDLGLDVEVLSLYEYEKNMLEINWPQHWPQIKLYEKK